MLDLNVTGLSSEKQTRTTQVRHGDSLAALIERATTVLGVEKVRVPSQCDCQRSAAGHRRQFAPCAYRR